MDLFSVLDPMVDALAKHCLATGPCSEALWWLLAILAVPAERLGLFTSLGETGKACGPPAIHHKKRQL